MIRLLHFFILLEEFHINWIFPWPEVPRIPTRLGDLGHPMGAGKSILGISLMIRKESTSRVGGVSKLVVKMLIAALQITLANAKALAEKLSKKKNVNFLRSEMAEEMV